MEIKEILQELLNWYDRNEGAQSSAGLCLRVRILYGSNAIENTIFSKYLINSKKKGQVFYTHRGHRTNDPSKFWWKYGENEPRVKWLKEQIKELG